jgi:hypothetical protein
MKEGIDDGSSLCVLEGIDDGLTLGVVDGCWDKDGAALGSFPHILQVKGQYFLTLGHFPHRFSVFFLFSQAQLFGFPFTTLATNLTVESLHPYGGFRQFASQLKGHFSFTVGRTHR